MLGQNGESPCFTEKHNKLRIRNAYWEGISVFLLGGQMWENSKDVWMRIMCIRLVKSW